MNAGALNGPVVGARSGRWRTWERLQEASTLISGAYVQPQTAYYTVPIPAYATAVKLTATAGCTSDNAMVTANFTASSGPACKDLVLPWGDGKQLVVALGATVTVSLIKKGVRQGGNLHALALADAEVAVQLTNSSISGTGPTAAAGSATVYWNGISLVSVTGVTVNSSTVFTQSAVPALNGMLYGAHAGSFVGPTQFTPLISNPQLMWTYVGNNNAASSLFGMIDTYQVGPNGQPLVPGQGVPSYSAAPWPHSQSYVKLEWME